MGNFAESKVMVASPDIDLPFENGFLHFYKNLQEKENLIRLFDRSRSEESFYTAHGKDALYIAEKVYGTSTVLKYYGSKVPSVALKEATAIDMIKDLLLKDQFKVEIWESQGKSWTIAKQVLL